MKEVLIVGCGNIGNKLLHEYAKLCPDAYDPGKGILRKRDILYDFAFICVDTPMAEDGSCDLSQINRAIDETDAEIIVIRSTVPPTTTSEIRKRTGKRVVFSPEFYGTTQHCDENSFDFSFCILGGEKKDCCEVVQLLQDVYDARYRFCITDDVTAELCKYMANSMLAARVSFCVQFADIAKQYGVNYEELRELLLNDKRFNRAHTFVYADHPYWTSHCFDKDLPAITRFADAPLIKNIIDYNEKCKREYMGVQS